MEKEELALMKDYLMKTERKYVVFQKKVTQAIFIGAPMITTILGAIKFLSDKGIYFLLFSLLLTYFVYIVMFAYEKERNIRETLLMFIERVEHGKVVSIPSDAHTQECDNAAENNN